MEVKMTKLDLVKMVSQETGILRKDTKIVIDAFLDAIRTSLIQNKHIELREFGTFKNKKRREKLGRNPKTGEQIGIPPRVVPTFKFSKMWKNDVNKSNS